MAAIMLRAGVLVLAVFGSILSDSGVCNAGLTSGFVRDKDVSSDMPLDSDVFRSPPGKNAAQQVNFFSDFPILEAEFGF